jgi:hypothetical protein
MSATQFIITSIQNMSQADRETVFAAFAMDPPQATKSKAVKEPKADKKPRANAGKGTAWSAFSVKIQLDHKDEVDAVKKDAAQRRANAKMSGVPAPDDTKGAHLHWCSAYKAAHEDEWKAFKAEWELKNKAASDEEAAPMVGGGSTTAATAPGVATATAATAATEAAPKPKRGPKKLADMTPEEQAAAKAKRAENKAKKASAANSGANSADVSRSPSPPKVKDE